MPSRPTPTASQGLLRPEAARHCFAFILSEDARKCLRRIHAAGNEPLNYFNLSASGRLFSGCRQRVGANAARYLPPILAMVRHSPLPQRQVAFTDEPEVIPWPSAPLRRCRRACCAHRRPRASLAFPFEPLKASHLRHRPDLPKDRRSRPLCRRRS